MVAVCSFNICLVLVLVMLCIMDVYQFDSKVSFFVLFIWFLLVLTELYFAHLCCCHNYIFTWYITYNFCFHSDHLVDV